MSTLSHDLSASGREFHSLTAPIAKDLSPDRVLERCSCRRPLSADLNPDLAGV